MNIRRRLPTEDVPDELIGGKYGTQSLATNYSMVKSMLEDTECAREATVEDALALKLQSEIMENAFEFKIPFELALMLVNTDTPEDISDLKLPFENVLFNSPFAVEYEAKSGNICYTVCPYICVRNQSDLLLSFIATGVEIMEPRNYMFEAISKKLSEIRKDDEVYRLIVNFLYLLETDEVVIEKEREFSVSQRKKRLMRRKVGAGSVKLVLGEKLRNYISSLNSSHDIQRAHWVRGHWKHFLGERYKSAKGKKTWVYPFIRGRGIVRRKLYEVKSIGQ